MLFQDMKEHFGKSKEIMNIRILSLLLNIILDYFAIKLNYGVSGVAWATVIIECINMILVMLLAKNTIYYKFDKGCLKELLPLVKHGIIARIFDRGGILVLNVILSRLGTYEYAAHIVLNQIESFANDFCYGFGIGITTNVGIMLGKNDKEETKELKIVINKIMAVFTIIIPIIIFIVLLIFLPVLLKEQEPLLIGYKLIPLLVLYTILLPIRYKYSSIIEGMKELKFSAKLSGISNTIQILFAYILGSYFSITGVWIAFCFKYVFMIIILKNKIKSLNVY